MHKKTFLSVVMVLASVSGCATFDGIGIRNTDTDAFLAHIDHRTSDTLSASAPLDLDRCIAIALDNNHDSKVAELEARVAKLNRRIAFANFLPEITFDYTYTELNRAPATALFGAISTPMQDRIVHDTALNAQMPIFAPATWFLYALHRRGEELGEIAMDYTQQMIALQVTGLYFQCLATQASHSLLTAQRDATSTLVDEIAAYHHEGMVTDADFAQVRVLLMARENTLEINKRAIERNIAELLTAMGLSPTADLELDTATPLTAPPGELEDWLLEALLNHPRLAMADRLVAIEREKMRIALADFLPALVGFASRSHTSNSYMAYPYVSALGFTGLMTVFNGFANVNEYRAARTEREKAFVRREQESLAVMLEVVKARTALSDARAHRRLAEAAVSASQTKLHEEKAKMREGLLRPSEMLDTIAGHHEAQVNVTNARYQEQVMIAIAWNVLGKTNTETKDERND